MGFKIFTYLYYSIFFLLPVFLAPVFKNYNTSKWSLFYFTLFSLVTTSFFCKGLWKVPQLNKKAWWGLFALGGLAILSILFNWDGRYFHTVGDWICFITFTILSYNFIRIKGDQIWLPIIRATSSGVVAVASISVMQFLEVPIYKLVPYIAKGKISSVFGNPIFAGEYFGLALTILIFGFFQKISKLEKIIHFGAFVLGLLVMINLSSRAVILSFFLSLWGLLFFIPKEKLKKLRKVTILLFIVLGTITVVGPKIAGHFGGTNWAGNSFFGTDYFSYIKQTSFQDRRTLLVNSFLMTLDKPLLGHGPNQYLYQFLKYKDKWKIYWGIKEFSLENHPHNCYLEMAIELGYPFLILFLLLAGSFFLKVFRNPISKTDYPKKILLLQALSFLAIESFFNFPLDLPYPFMFMAFMLGFAGNFLKIPPQNLPPRLVYAFPLPIAGFIGYLGGAFTLAQFHFRMNHTSIELSRLACRLLPDFWATCTHLGEVLTNNKRYDEAIEVLQKELKKYPYFFPVMRSLSNAYLGKKDVKNACRHMKSYLDTLNRPTKRRIDLIYRRTCQQKRVGSKKPYGRQYSRPPQGAPLVLRPEFFPSKSRGGR